MNTSNNHSVAKTTVNDSRQRACREERQLPIKKQFRRIYIYSKARKYVGKFVHVHVHVHVNSMFMYMYTDEYLDTRIFVIVKYNDREWIITVQTAICLLPYMYMHADGYKAAR